MENTHNPQINMSKIPVAGNIMGAVFALAAIAICIVGIPVLLYVLPLALVAGCGVALALHYVQHH